MKDRTLLFIALGCSITGLVVLFVVFQVSEVEVQPIEKIRLMDGQKVAIKGEVKKVMQKQDLTVVQVGYDTSIDVVVFDKLMLRPGQKVLVTGTLKEYNGRPEIVGEKLVVSP